MTRKPPRRKTASRTRAAKRAPPWEQDAPHPGQGHQRLTPRAKAAAKRRAKAAGRPYPNLVDNMRAARESRS